jgi:hypothetical protein
MNLFTDDDTTFTIQETGFKNATIAKKSIIKINKTFNSIKKQINIPGPSPDFLNPKTFLKNKTELDFFIEKQKMYRVLALLNRAKVVFRKTPNINIQKAIKIFEDWMMAYKMKS